MRVSGTRYIPDLDTFDELLTLQNIAARGMSVC